jgi:hypothetical protein
VSLAQGASGLRDCHRAVGNNAGTETAQKPRAFMDLRQALNLLQFPGSPSCPDAGSWEPDLAHERGESALEEFVTGEGAQQMLQRMLGQMERQHRQGMTEVVQACRQQLSALHVSALDGQWLLGKTALKSSSCTLLWSFSAFFECLCTWIDWLGPWSQMVECLI